MACNENIIKNMANEITRNCQTKNTTVDNEFVVYLIELMLLNPKYNKLFSSTINRNNLQYFVEQCVDIIVDGATSLNTLKLQFLIQSNYDKLDVLIEKHMSSIETCLNPLLSEILEAEPDPDNEPDMRKLLRKISIYIILASGLGNPGVILTLKEAMCALESIYSVQDLKVFLGVSRAEKVAQLRELLEVSSGVRLFNRDCKKGGDGIGDLPLNLLDASKGCLTQLSNSLIMVMQRVNMLNSAVEDCMHVEENTGTVIINPQKKVSEKNYKDIFDLLAFYRQYELITRRLLHDVEGMVVSGSNQVDTFHYALEEIHTAVKYKVAVPVVTVFPLFARVWGEWRAMQNVMYLASVVSKVLTGMAAILECVITPAELLHAIMQERKDSELVIRPSVSTSRMSIAREFSHRISALSTLADAKALSEKHMQYLGFCAICLCGGALIPSVLRVTIVHHKGKRYSFCNWRMADKFSKDPQRYINEFLEYARNNPQLIHLLNIMDDVSRVKDISVLQEKFVLPTEVFEKNMQTETHPIEQNIERNYSWDLWEWKRRACQWANIVNCQTHSTQTHYSHMRCEVLIQTTEMRDKALQTMKDCGVNTDPDTVFLWGLRSAGCDQHRLHLKGETTLQRPILKSLYCGDPCVGCAADSGDKLYHIMSSNEIESCSTVDN